MNRIQTLPIGRVGLAEKKAGVSLTTLEDPTSYKADILAALVWQVKVHEGDKVTFEDVAFNMTLEECIEFLGLNTEDNEENLT